MQVGYIASIGSPEKGKRGWMERDKSCFDRLDELDAYAKEIYFNPSSETEKTRLQVLGFEKAAKNKAVMNRVWTTRWGLHICVGGKGYYNDIPITRGTCFLSWPYVKHSIVADKDDPLEFYWIILCGPDVVEYVSSYGFSDLQPVFTIDCVDDMVKLFELGMNTDYKNVDVYEYTMGLVGMLLSYPKPRVEKTDEARWIEEQGKDYTRMVKQLLKNNNYAISISELARRIGVSDKHLSRVFANDTGEALKRYIVRKKFDLAARLIKSGASPTEVSNILEYSNYAAFHRMFVRQHGVTPKQYMTDTVGGTSDGKKKTNSEKRDLK